jgi:hypothetical protein
MSNDMRLPQLYVYDDVGDIIGVRLTAYSELADEAESLERERDDRNTAYLSQMREINALKTKRDELVAAIHEALDYFEDREDVVDGAYGEQAPNKEMSLARMLRDAIKGTT